MVREPWAITREMFLSVDEVDRLMAHLARRHETAVGEGLSGALVDRVIIETLLFSGIRCSEFCRLRQCDIHLDPRAPSLEIRGMPREERTVHIPLSLARLIREYFEARGLKHGTRGAGKRPTETPFVVNERGKPYERTALYRRVVRILAGAGLAARASVQLLRHTYGYLAYRNTGGNLLFVQRQLGHAHPMVTSVYARFADESDADMANLVAAPRRPRAPTGRRMKRKAPIE
jgi:integrase/recombinase XerD